MPSESAALEKESKTFRVLVAVHRPRYRARTERAMTGLGWVTRSLLNKEDPVGLVHQRRPNVLIISDDFGRQKDLGILRAVQRFRDSGMKIVALFEDSESARENGELCDTALSPPWKTVDMRAVLSRIYTEVTGEAVEGAVELEQDEDE